MTDSEIGKFKFQKVPPHLIVIVETTFNCDIANEMKIMLDACEGDKKDRFGHIKYWKCMLKLIPHIISMVEIKRSDVKSLTKQINFSEDQIIRSLDRFVLKNVLVKHSSRFNSVWKLNSELFLVLYFFSKQKKLEHIARLPLIINETQLTS
jgi:5'(3')-deoxyribonucleotidase